MGDRRRKEEQKAAAAQPKSSSRQTTSFVAGNGIDREVITTDIYRYLGNDALVKPGTYQETEGYFITAYRPLTSEQLRDIKNDSAKWQEEKRRNRGPTGGYDNSDTRQKIWGEADTRQPPPTTYAPPSQPMSYGSSIPPPNQPMGRGYDPYQPPNQMSQTGTYRPPQQSPYNTTQEAQYVTYSPPLAVHNYNTMNRDPSQRMDEPRSINQPYGGPPQGPPSQPPYPPASGRGVPQYYSSTGLPPSGPPPVQYQEPPYQYGRAPAPERQPYEFPDQDEEMEYDAPPPSGPNPPASAAQSRPAEGNRKRTHESDRHRRHQ